MRAAAAGPHGSPADRKAHAKSACRSDRKAQPIDSDELPIEDSDAKSHRKDTRKRYRPGQKQYQKYDVYCTDEDCPRSMGQGGKPFKDRWH